MYLEFPLQPVQQLAAGLHRALGGLAKLFQQLAEVLVILLEQLDGIHRDLLLGVGRIQEN
ncbi:hypothetical protein D9M71_797640 [compost metagenome]